MVRLSGLRIVLSSDNNGGEMSNVLNGLWCGASRTIRWTGRYITHDDGTLCEHLVDIAQPVPPSCSCGFDNGECGCVILSQSERELTLRRMLWLSHGCHGLYGDDGEMQCPECRLDFRRDPVETIDRRITERGMRRLAGGDADQSRRMANALERIAKALGETGHTVGNVEQDLDYIVNAATKAIRNGTRWDRQHRCVP